MIVAQNRKVTICLVRVDHLVNLNSDIDDSSSGKRPPEVDYYHHVFSE